MCNHTDSDVCRQHPAALMQSPDALLEHVTELSCKKQQRMFALSQWSNTLADAEAVAVASARRSTQLQHAAAEAVHRIKEGETLCKTFCKPVCKVLQELCCIFNL